MWRGDHQHMLACVGDHVFWNCRHDDDRHLPSRLTWLLMLAKSSRLMCYIKLYVLRIYIAFIYI
jgi:hypothetical protein